MTFEIERDGSRWHVTLRRDADGWNAAIDGREFVVSLAQSGERWSMLVGPAEAGRQREGPAAAGHHNGVASGVGESLASYDVSVERAASGGGLVVHVNGVAVPLAVVEPRQQWRRARGHSAGDGGSQTIVAPMPGRIVKVLVTPGQPVQPRQGLVVIEAMKMENELRASRAGTVADVRVTEGASVEANAVLLVLD